MKRTRVPFLLAALLMPVAYGCEKPGDEKQPDGAPGTTPAVLVAMESGLSAAEREAFYHRAEGSEAIPYAWVKALHSVTTGRPFLEQPDRFGLIADPDNEDGLPIGLTAATTVDTRLFGVRMTGINCAACHVNELTYGGKRMIIDGAPATFQADSFKTDLFASLNHTVRDPAALLAFLWRLRRQHEPHNPHMPVGVREETSRLLAGIEDVAGAEPGAATLLRWVTLALERERSYPPVDMLDGLSVAPQDSATGARNSQQGPRLPRPLTYEGVAAEVEALIPADSAAEHVRHFQAGGTLSPEDRIEAFVSDVLLTARLLKARVHAMRRTLPPVDTTTNGWGRVDAFGVARNSIFPRDSVPVTAPVSYPWLWGFGEQPWFHYDGNTNSVMQRNLGQAIGVGAVYDSVTLVSTLDPYAIHFLEMTARKITPPRWPEDVLGRIDQQKAARGEALFQSTCAGCHTAKPSERQFTVAEMGTDSNRMVNFAQPMLDGRHFTDHASVFLAGVEAQAYRLFKVPLDSQKVFRGPERPVWRTTSTWVARPLNGVWATPPFLHNGSVPTLHDLLLPAAQRPARFPLGHREYDPQKLGLTTNVTNPRQVFDTSVSGNRNVGHEYGTRLSAEERSALLEYLKKL